MHRYSLCFPLRSDDDNRRPYVDFGDDCSIRRLMQASFYFLRMYVTRLSAWPCTDALSAIGIDQPVGGYLHSTSYHANQKIRPQDVCCVIA